MKQLQRWEMLKLPVTDHSLHRSYDRNGLNRHETHVTLDDLYVSFPLESLNKTQPISKLFENTPLRMTYESN